MHTIQIADRVFEYLKADEDEMFYNGAYRRYLYVECDPDAIDLTELNKLLTEENLASIALSNSEVGVTNYHDGYTVKMECGIKQEKVQEESFDHPAVYADRLVFKLGRRTYIEEALHKLGL